MDIREVQREDQFFNIFQHRFNRLMVSIHPNYVVGENAVWASEFTGDSTRVVRMLRQASIRPFIERLFQRFAFHHIQVLNPPRHQNYEYFALVDQLVAYNNFAHTIKNLIGERIDGADLTFTMRIRRNRLQEGSNWHNLYAQRVNENNPQHSFGPEGFRIVQFVQRDGQNEFTVRVSEM
ncbi:hypothetical protein M3Y97_00757000 [Aphelenchoides bicaudatus]|nr:hypothetical protein M3Y97_00757000 [Aphelenchoides bicaudatus]